MSNEVATTNRNAGYVARYADAAGDPYTNFASESGPGIQGTRLSCAKGDWTAGADKTPVPAVAKFLALVPTSSRGWVKWMGSQLVDARHNLVVDNVPMLNRYALGDTDESQWERNPDGSPRDPWGKDYRFVLVSMAPPHAEFTFIGSSHGARVALQDLCRSYGADRQRYPDAFPVVSLAVSSRQTQSYGTIKGPKFVVEGWAKLEDVKAGKKTATKAKAVTKAEVQAELDDEIPTWGAQ
jgi:hypothetical protein